MQIARDEGEDVRIIASLEEEEIGTLSKNPDTYRYSYANPEETFVIPYVKDGVRMWQSLHLVRVAGFPNHYIFVETSLEHLDQLLAERVRTAYYWLVAILMTILFLLVRHVRLIDYSYLYREAKKANETKDLFTNMIAHELRAPLTAIRGYGSMIRERAGVDAATQHNAQEIESAAGRLVTIVSDLLDIARIQSGKMEITREQVHLSGLIRSVTEALHPGAVEKHIQLKVEDMDGSVMVRSDEKRLFQVFTNVLSNAIKYTKEGTITIALSASSDRVEIRVKDTGMGISASDQQKMFAPFFRVEGKDTASITGTGLGLWVTKQLVELMEGSVGVESIKGIGTHVVITLPK
jgi:signal transduction histidine kinase